jgi:hypothetical protein
MYFNAGTKVSRKDHDVVAEGQNPFVKTVKEVMGVPFRFVSQIRATNALQKEGVAREYCVLAQLVHRRSLGVARNTDRGNHEIHSGGQLDRLAVNEGLKVEPEWIGGVQPQCGATRRGEFARTAQMVGVEMGIEHVSDSPSTILGYLSIIRYIPRGVDHDGTFARADYVGEASLASPTQLNNRGARELRRDVIVR